MTLDDLYTQLATATKALVPLKIDLDQAHSNLHSALKQIGFMPIINTPNRRHPNLAPHALITVYTCNDLTPLGAAYQTAKTAHDAGNKNVDNINMQIKTAITVKGL